MRVLSRVFRGKYLDGLRQAFAQEQLVFPGRSAAVAAPAEFQQWLKRLREKEWVVYSQPPFAGPEKVLDYLSRYDMRCRLSKFALFVCGRGCRLEREVSLRMSVSAAVMSAPGST